MLDFIRQVLTLLTTTPGSLAYHLVLAFSLAGAVQATLGSWRATGQPAAWRATLGVSLLLAVRLLLFTVAALAWQGIIAVDFLAPLDRGIALISLVVVIWLWVFPEPARLADTANLLLALLVSVFVLFSLLWWNSNRSVPFQGSWPDTASSLLALALLALASLVIAFKRPEGWGVGLSMFALLFAGHLGHLLVPLPGVNLAPAVRLAEMAAFPLLLALPLRTPALVSTQPLPAQPDVEETKPPDALQLLQPFINLVVEGETAQSCTEVTRTIAQSVSMDLCYLIYGSEQTEQLELRCGYNRVNQQAEPAANVPVHLVPTLATSLRRGRTLRLPASSISSELTGLVRFLGLTNVSHLLAVPAASKGEQGFYGLLLLSADVNRVWSTQEQDYLARVATLLGWVLQRSGQTLELQAEVEQVRRAFQETQSKNEQLQHENEDYLVQLEAASSSFTQAVARAESLAALVASHEKDGRTSPELEAEVKQLKEALQAAQNTRSPELEQLEGELRLVLEEVARLRTQLAEADQKLLDLQGTPGGKALSDEQQIVFTAISQEIRQPLSSIVGYTDLLLGESVGTLGALQRKFLERIKASVERMGALIDDLMQVTFLEGAKPDLTPATVDLNSVIDEALAITIAQMREKNILLRVDLAEHLPAIQADRDAIQQLLIHLLQNAGSATPEEGQISLHARLREDDQEYVLLQVSDSGGGIAPEDLPRVFSRLYKGDNTSIKGLGGSGVGLAVVKSLVEAHGGRISVDSQPGVGSTFSVLLPVSNPVAQSQSRRRAVP